MKLSSPFAIATLVLAAACGQKPDQTALEARLAAVEARVAKLEAPTTATSHPSPTSAPPSAVSPVVNSNDSWQIVKVESRVTESNSSWSKYAWQLVLRNDAPEAAVFDATIEFKDSDGFVVDDDTEYKLVVPARSEETFAGYDLVNADVAGKISSTSAKVKRHS